MKKYILISMIALLIACDNEDQTPVTEYAATWAYDEVGLRIYFGITRKNGILEVVNSKVTHSSIPSEESTNNEAVAIGATAMKLDAIHITSKGSVEYSVELNDIKSNGVSLSAGEIVVSVPGEATRTLENKPLTRQ